MEPKIGEDEPRALKELTHRLVVERCVLRTTAWGCDRTALPRDAHRYLGAVDLSEGASELLGRCFGRRR